MIQLELFFSVNILQFIFLALRLDEFIRWRWVVSNLSFTLYVAFSAYEGLLSSAVGGTIQIHADCYNCNCFI